MTRDTTASTARTSAGTVEGVQHNGIHRFLGIPYAAPPTGKRRFRPPVEPDRWEGVRPCLSVGPACPQLPASNERYAVTGPQDEDCLSLNVWTPGLDEASRPVMIFFHGGGYLAGSGGVDVYDSARLAERGVVAITCNYRLAAFGFLYLDELFDGMEGTGNLGLLDHIRALEWIHENIAAFGGDPSRITIFGSSAGGISAATLMAMPRARKLFNRSVPLSCAAGVALTPEKATAITRLVLEDCGVEPGDTEALLGLGSKQLVGDRDRIIAIAVAAGGMMFGPVIDGKHLPELPINAIAAGDATGIDLMIGCTAEETGARHTETRSALDALALRDVPLPRHDSARGFDFAQLFGPDGPADSEILDVYSASLKAAHRPAELVDVFAQAYSDVRMLKPTTRFAELHAEHHPNTYVFRFMWPSPGWDGALGSFHGVMTPFVFDNLDDPTWAYTLGPTPPESLADDMQQALTSFAATGVPVCERTGPWPPFDLKRHATMLFGTPSRLVDDPEQPRRLLYERAAMDFERR